MHHPQAVIRYTFFGACLLLLACSTVTQPNAIVARVSPDPAPIFNFQIVNPGKPDGSDAIYRSGQPEGEAQWSYLEKLGIKTVVKLNEFSNNVNETEELSLAKKHNINVMRIYMPPEDFPHNWNLWAHPDQKVLLQAVAALEDAANLPALVHCSHGKDRTGIVVALYSVRNKKYCKDAAIEEMKFYGTNPLLFGLKPMLDSADIVQDADCSHQPGNQ
jgi:protein-tyrosine phosphatase